MNINRVQKISNTTPYFAHIDGLRAMAVMMVVLFHTTPTWMPAGYLGVDIFFVISGFVITQSLVKDYYEHGKIRVGNFYSKRVRRLYPALLSMIVGTLAAIFLFGFLWDTNFFIKSAIASLFGVSNLYYLFRGDPYFENDFLNPFLHTWSLGVEEQFYFIYPLLLSILLAVISKTKKNISLYVGVILLLLSLGLLILVYAFPNSLLVDFYSPIARFWEIGIGCALYFLSRIFTVRGLYSVILSIIALFLLVSLFSLPSIYNDLAKATVVSSIVTTFLIFAGLSSTSNVTRVFATRPFVYIGKISYSMYLWHLPVVYFALLYLDKWFVPVVILSTLLLATLSYYCIETPLRHSLLFEKVLSRIINNARLIAGFIVIGIFVVVFFDHFGTLKNFTNFKFNAVGEWAERINYLETSYNLGDRVEAQYLFSDGSSSDACNIMRSTQNNENLPYREDCLKVNNSKTIFFLTGDSHAQHLLPAVSRATIPHDLYFLQLDSSFFLRNKNPMRTAQDYPTEIQETLYYLSDVYDNIYHIVSFYFSQHTENISEIRFNLTTYLQLSSEHQKIILVAPTPVFPVGPMLCVVRGLSCTIDTSKEYARRKAVMDIYRELAEKLENVYLYDPYPVLCDEKGCSIYEKEIDLLRFRDTDHLTKEMSLELAPHFKTWLKETFPDLMLESQH